MGQCVTFLVAFVGPLSSRALQRVDRPVEMFLFGMLVMYFFFRVRGDLKPRGEDYGKQIRIYHLGKRTGFPLKDECPHCRDILDLKDPKRHLEKVHPELRLEIIEDA